VFNCLDLLYFPNSYINRDNRKITRLLRQAKLRLNAQATDIDYQTKRGLNKSTVAQLLQFNWVKQHRNILTEGSTGRGRPFLACVLGQACCEKGVSVRYYRASRLLEMLTIAQGDGSFGKVLMQLRKTEVLIIDDWGLGTLKRQQSMDLMEVIEDRHSNGSTIITSQLPTNHWHEKSVTPHSLTRYWIDDCIMPIKSV
jgi:DNA replication protein DnaC